MPTVLDLAQIANDIYRDETDPFRFTSFGRVSGSFEHTNLDMRARCYGCQGTLVIAFMGTKPEHKGTMAADMSIAVRVKPRLFDEALMYFFEKYKKYRRSFQDCLVTGHSLGGWHCAVCCGHLWSSGRYI